MDAEKPRRDELAAPRRFDHAALRDWPEYTAVAAAIEKLGARMDREGFPLERDEFAAAVEDVARVAYAADRCEECGQRAWPHRNTTGDGSVDGVYWCLACRREWTCYYAAPEAFRGL